MAVGFSGFPVTISARRYPQGVAATSPTIGQATTEFFSSKTPWPMSQSQDYRTLSGMCVFDYWFSYYDNGTKFDGRRRWPQKFTPGSQMYWGFPLCYGATAEHYNGKIYIFGGYRRSAWFGDTYHRRMFVYDIAKNTITDMGDQDLPGREMHGSCIYDNKMWIFGGRGPYRRLDDLWCYDFASGKWTRKAVGSPVTPRWRFGRKLVVIGGKFYVWGGLDKDDNALASMSVYDTVTDTWADNVSQGTNPPSSRYDQTVWEDQNRYYMALGSASPMWYFDPAGGTQKWTQLSTPSYNKSYAMSFVHQTDAEKVLYIVGNANGTTAPTDYTYKWNMNTQQWSYGVTSWYDAGWFAFCYVDGKIYGFGSSYSQSRNHMCYFDCEKEQWFSLCGSEGSWMSRYAASAAFSGRKVYITGGRMYSRQSEGPWNTNGAVWAADIDSKACEMVGVESVYRRYTRAKVWDGKLYIFGGYNESWAMNRVSILDLTTKQWSIGKAMPEGLYGHTVVLYNGKFYLFGGTTEGYGVRERLWMYDPVANTWTAKADCPRRLYGHEAHVFNGKMYVMFGYDQTTSYTDTMYIYDLDANTWSSIVPSVNDFGRPNNTRYNLTSWGKDQYWFFMGDEGNRSTEQVWYLDLGATTSGVWTPTWFRGVDTPRGNSRNVQAATDPATGRGYLIGGPVDTYQPTIESMTCYL